MLQVDHAVFNQIFMRHMATSFSIITYTKNANHPSKSFSEQSVK